VSDEERREQRNERDRDERGATRETRVRVHVSPEQIPVVGSSMPVLKLGPVVSAPESLLAEAVRAVAPSASLVAFGDRGLRAAFDGDRLVAAVHPTTGESRVFPALEALRPGRCAERARALAQMLLREGKLFPADDTDVVGLEPTVLAGSTHARGSESVSGEYLAYVRFQRRVGGARVFGPGTRAMIAVAADESLRAFAYRWRVAQATDRRVEPHLRERVAEAIRDQLAGVSKTADVRLENVTVAYYDGGGEFLQPVYRFQATVDPPPVRDSGQRGATRRFCGYVSIGIAPEPLPLIGAKPGPSPTHPSASRAPTPPAPGDPAVGRYVVRNDSDEWVASANEFLGGLKEAQDFFGGPIPFTDAQYYWAYPWEFTSNKDDFVNSVHIALNEVHGNWGWFSTRDNNDDGVSLSDMIG